MAHYAFQLPNFMKRFGPNPDDLSMDFFASYVSDPINRIQWRLYFKRHAKENSDKEYISVYLKLMKFFDGQCRQVTHRPVVEVTYSIGIRDQEFACVHSKTATHSDWTTDWGWREFLPLDAAREHLLPDGSLFVFCNLDPKQEGRYSIPPSPPSQPSSRCTRFLANSPRTEPTGLGQKLLNDKHHTDVTIVAGEKNPVTFQAHKAVLCIQSSVFAQGFDHKFLPDLPSSHVRVKDFDADTVREMINYVYTGRTDKMTEMAHLLLPAAEKYQLEGEARRRE
ncbi:PREDICTED: BTB and MATH domain-containing protein 43-like [Priapulus caudatus]|uniref:BTB and MATH domain-containing protein 43-like n=1 Tax=Priapulus caudatus TaxID=37621 RepID=A0ABM1E5D4_PRICU|nr:PREDICTED: BTB and MATH domain-containing protein 43-like [Priapulus caudatus]